MTIGHLLEDFGAYATGKPVSLTDVRLEEERLEAFEKGYQAGWDDSAKAQSEDGMRVSADLAQNLQDLSFTYNEAHSAVLNSLQPLLQQIIETVLPRAVHQTLGTRLAEVLQELASDHGEQSVELVVAPANSASLEELVSTELSLPLKIVKEPSLADGQIYIRFGEVEREVDLTEVLSEIDRAVTGFFKENNKETA